MNKPELTALLAELVPQRAGRRVLSGILDAVEDSVIAEQSAFNMFEIGLSSASPERFQINHIHGYRGCEKGWEAMLAKRKAGAVLEIAKDLNRRMRCSFDAARLEGVLKILTGNRSVFSRVLFSFEFDRRAGRPAKLTTYGILRSVKDERDLRRVLGVRSRPQSAKKTLEDLFNIGVDFHADGSLQLKIYKRWPLLLSLLEDERGKAFLRSLHDLLPLRDYGSMVRLDRDGAVIEPAKWGVNFSQTTRVRDLLFVPGLKDKFSDFLAFASRHCSELEISYLGFEAGAFGIYCGRGFEPWLTSTQPAAGGRP